MGVTPDRLNRSSESDFDSLAILKDKLAHEWRQRLEQVLAARQPLPSEAELETVFVAALAETTALRREGFSRELTDEAAGRLFALAFALEEMRRTFRDLGHDVEVTALAPEQD